VLSVKLAALLTVGRRIVPVPPDNVTLPLVTPSAKSEDVAPVVVQYNVGSEYVMFVVTV
jgi:hypothetical protein